MKKFVIERNLPGAGNLTAEELRDLADNAVGTAGSLNKPYTWIQSFITADKIYCVHIAESEALIREHARLAGFPCHSVSEVIEVIDPSTAPGRVKI